MELNYGEHIVDTVGCSMVAKSICVALKSDTPRFNGVVQIISQLFEEIIFVHWVVHTTWTLSLSGNVTRPWSTITSAPDASASQVLLSPSQS